MVVALWRCCACITHCPCSGRVSTNEGRSPLRLRDRMRRSRGSYLMRLVLCLVVPAALGTALADASAASAPTVSPIQATFVQSEFATHYVVTAEDPNAKTLT